MKNDKEKFKMEFKKKLYQFTLRLLKFIDSLPKDRSTTMIADQLLRSGTSICANYVEAQASGSKKDFANFFNISLKSANESKFWLALLRDSGKADPKEVEWFLRELTEIGNVLGSSLLTLRGRRQSF